MNASAVRRSCVFCGQSGLTPEHVYPRWLQHVFPSIQDQKGYHEVCGPDGVIKRRWIARPFAVVVSRVCRPCNNGWMSELETDGRPFLEPMMRGQKVSLSPEAQTVVAAWAVKTAMMLQYVPGEPVVIHAKHYTELFQKKRQPPDTCMVWASVCRKDMSPPLITNWSRSLILETEPPPPAAAGTIRGYRVTFRINQLALQIWGYNDESLSEPYLIQQVEYGGFAPFIHTIWPTSSTDLTWPPPGVFATDGLEAFAMRIT